MILSGHLVLQECTIVDKYVDNWCTCCEFHAEATLMINRLTRDFSHELGGL